MESVHRGRPEAAAVIWDWQTPVRPEGSGSAGHSRLRGTLQAAVGVGVGTVFLVLGLGLLAAVVFTVAGLLLSSALLSPNGLYAAIDRAFRVLGRWVGQTLSWILLPAIFYLVFFPFGRFFRRGENDRMKRFFETEAATYWQPHRTIPASRSYRRQF